MAYIYQIVEMSYFADICLICLKHSNNLVSIKHQDTTGRSIEEKLELFLLELTLNSNIPKYICAKCEDSLNKSYEFKQICLQNIPAYEKRAQHVTTFDSSYKNDFVCKEEQILNIAASQTEFNVNIVKNEEFIIKEEILSADSVSQLTENQNVSVQEQNIKSEIDANVKTGNDNTCEICSKSFSNAQYLKKHKLQHTSEKPFSCTICEKSFRLLQQLKRHNSVHTGEKPFTCEVCNKSYRHLATFKAHKLVHTDKKPFTCKICKKSFRRLAYLNTHELIHTDGKPFPCRICNKSFRQSIHLQQHHLIHTGEKPYTCEVCKRSFQRKFGLQRHKKLVHR